MSEIYELSPYEELPSVRERENAPTTISNPVRLASR